MSLNLVIYIPVYHIQVLETLLQTDMNKKQAFVFFFSFNIAGIWALLLLHKVTVLQFLFPLC